MTSGRLSGCTAPPPPISPCCCSPPFAARRCPIRCPLAGLAACAPAGGHEKAPPEQGCRAMGDPGLEPGTSSLSNACVLVGLCGYSESSPSSPLRGTGEARHFRLYQDPLLPQRCPDPAFPREAEATRHRFPDGGAWNRPRREVPTSAGRSLMAHCCDPSSRSCSTSRRSAPSGGGRGVARAAESVGQRGRSLMAESTSRAGSAITLAAAERRSRRPILG